ncbi:MAG: glycosyltransferase family 4 protein [Acidobacteria bacterium]|nr:glycosyltransferase family 4 protein [Acidobacteriota bacterium]
MKKIQFIERKFDGFVSIEKVFGLVAENLPKDKFIHRFQKLRYGSSVAGIIKNLLFFKAEPADVYHITGHVHFMALALPRRKTVLTIHDLRFLKHDSGWRRFFLKKLFLDWPLKKLIYVTAISEFTKSEIVSNTGVSPEKIRVIENPLDRTMTRQRPEKKAFNTDCPRVLQIGTMENKNLPNLVKALAGTECELRVIGPLDERQDRLLKRSGIRYSNRSGLSDDEIRQEYENADIVAFCSIYEGFGLPIIEAQAMAKPVITSNLSPMKEIAGDAAWLADPFDHRDIRRGILKIINEISFREQIIENGLKNIRRFEPAAIVGEYEKLYEEIIAGNKK